MGSLRTRLAGAAVVFAVVLTLGVGLVALTEGWRRDNLQGERDVDLLVFRTNNELERADERGDTHLPEVGSSEFVALLDQSGAVIDASANIDRDRVERAARDELAVADLPEGDVALGELTDGGTTWSIVAERCIAPERCDVVVVGRRPERWLGYVTARLGWLLGGALAIGATSWFGARWLVGRSLRSVDAMRAELDAITATDLARRVDVPDSGDELEALGTSMNHAIARLADAVDAQRRFVSDAAHELRSPLAGTRATLELAQRDPQRADEAIDAALPQIDRTSRLIDDLLALARRDGRAAPRARVSNDIDDLVRLEIADWRLRHPAIRLDRSNIEPIQSSVDADAIRRVVRNLADNAAAYCDRAVTVSLRRAADRWQLVVDDDGPGIAPADRGRVFERFTRLDEARSHDTGGAGLGLAIVSDIVADHGGTITIADSPAGGASFRVSVPIDDAHGSERS